MSSPPRDELESFGQMLRRQRKTAEVSQNRLAADLKQEPTYVSKWENDRRGPPREDVSRIAACLGLSGTDAALLDEAWERTHGPPSEFSADALIDSALRIATAAERFRALGEPRQAYEIALTGDILVPPIFRRRWRDSERALLAEAAASVQYAAVKAALDFMSEQDVRNGALRDVIAIENRLSYVARRSRSLLEYSVAREALLYASGEGDSAAQLNSELMEIVDSLEEGLASETLRAEAINAARTGRRSALDRVVAHLDSHEGIDGDMRAFVLEGIVRGGASLDPQRALEALEEVKKWYAARPEASPVRRIQIVRAACVLAHEFEGGLDSTGVADAEAALAEAESKALDKYVAELRRYLDR